MFKKLLKPLIWIKDAQENAVLYLTKKADKKIGASDRNRFKDWKLKQPVWKQLLIELPIYINILVIEFVFQSVRIQNNALVI